MTLPEQRVGLGQPSAVSGSAGMLPCQPLPDKTAPITRRHKESPCALPS